MSEEEGQNRPNVYPSQEEIDKANSDTPQKNYPNPDKPEDMGEATSDADLEAQKEMARRREQEIKNAQQQKSGQGQTSGQFDTQQFSRQMEEPKAPMEDENTSQRMEKGEENEYAKEKDETLPPGDYIGLPSDGKIYKHGKDHIRVAFLTASDENILTSPNLLESGEFLKVLMNRKIIDEDIHYEDLHVGDRNAILIWLRATGYGTSYPVTITDPSTGEDFERDIDLSNLKTKELQVEPDEQGLFHYKLPVSQSDVKFKLLTIRDVEDIEEQVKREREELNYKIDNTITYTLMKHIIEMDGRTDRPYINWAVNNMRVGDSRGFRKYVADIEPGMDLNITVRTPGGESLTTFLPIGPQFFWPDIGA